MTDYSVWIYERPGIQRFPIILYINAAKTDHVLIWIAFPFQHFLQSRSSNRSMTLIYEQWKNRLSYLKPDCSSCAPPTGCHTHIELSSREALSFQFVCGLGVRILINISMKANVQRCIPSVFEYSHEVNVVVPSWKRNMLHSCFLRISTVV